MWAGILHFFALPLPFDIGANLLRPYLDLLLPEQSLPPRLRSVVSLYTIAAEFDFTTSTFACTSPCYAFLALLLHNLI